MHVKAVESSHWAWQPIAFKPYSIEATKKYVPVIVAGFDLAPVFRPKSSSLSLVSTHTVILRLRVHAHWPKRATMVVDDLEEVGEDKLSAFHSLSIQCISIKEDPYKEPCAPCLSFLSQEKWCQEDICLLYVAVQIHSM